MPKAERPAWAALCRDGPLKLAGVREPVRAERPGGLFSSHYKKGLARPATEGKQIEDLTKVNRITNKHQRSAYIAPVRQ